MLESLITWLADLPPVAVYGVLALMAAIENVFPPFPADTAIALGAFLAHRGVTEPWLVFVVTIVSNMSTAMGMYWLASHHATTLFGSRVVRRFLSDDGLERVRAEYQRFGIAGLFIGRMLPGFRAVVAPFAGLMRLGAWRAFLPMFLASAIWYGGLVFLAAALGNQLDRIVGIIGGINRSLGIISITMILALVGWVIIRRRRARRDAT
jgi:membrane protein DedA with SNARE-associated domain